MKKAPTNLPDHWGYDEKTDSVICGDCSFRYGAEHEDHEGGWTCPVCEQTKKAAPARPEDYLRRWYSQY